MAVTMQAVSGAGYPGVASLDILGNVIPYIAKEEEKMEEETLKLLGHLNGAGVRMGEFRMSAQCNRVAVEDGHIECVSVKLKKQAKAEEMISAWRDFRSLPVLADVLEEAGCTDEGILSHCRGPGPHARGCWVIDLLTGRE